MRNLSVIVGCLLFSCIGTKAFAQDSLAEARLKSLRGVIAPFSTIEKKDSVFLICFWSTENEQSVDQLNAMKSMVAKPDAPAFYRFLAVSVDVGKYANKLRPMVNMNEWTFEVYGDLYGDLRRSLHSENLPQSFILKNGKILYQQSGWNAGSEKFLFEKLEEIRKQKS